MEQADSDMHLVVTKMTRDMKILAGVTIVLGAIYTLTILLAIVGVPYLIAGLRLRSAANEFRGWLDQEPGALFRALRKQRQYFFIVTLLVVIGVIVSFVMIAAQITFGVLSTFSDRSV